LCRVYLKIVILAKTKDLNIKTHYILNMDTLIYSLMLAVMIIASCLLVFTIIYSNAKYYIINITPDSISYHGDYVYITYTFLVPVMVKPIVLVPVTRTIYGYKNLVYNLYIGANCSFVMFNETMFDWGRCN